MLELNKIYNMDCIEGMKLIPDNSIDSIVTDPPYEIGFMGKGWDSTGIANNVDMRKECLRVLKPGGHLLSFAATRTYHRMTCAIEDAGFEVRDMIEWVYGCLSEDTEILTKEGWKHYNKITGNNPVYCYNVDRDIFEYHLPTSYFLYENKHPAYRIQSDNTDQIVSRNHRVAVEQDGRIIFKYAETLKQQENIPVLENMPEMSKTIGNTHKGTSHKEQILLGLCMKSYIREKEMKTEGYKLYVGEELGDMLKSVYDKEEQTLKVLLEQMQLNSEMKGISETLAQVKELMDRTIQTIIQSKDVMTELQVLEELRNSYEKEMKVCKSDDKICEMSDGAYGDGKEGLICDGTQVESSDGDMKTIDENGVCASHESQCGGQQDGELDVIQDELRAQELGALKRYTTTLATITEVEYDGYVWCVEVPIGCFVARRNGKIFITGNSGFPKSLNIGKAVDKLQGNEREETHKETKADSTYHTQNVGETIKNTSTYSVTKGTSEWEGWGTALKPAHEPICMARKPLGEKTIVENVLKWGTGGINIDESRVETEEKLQPSSSTKMKFGGNAMLESKTMNDPDWIQNSNGRFPANLIHDNSEEVRECFPDSKSSKFPVTNKPIFNTENGWNKNSIEGGTGGGYEDNGNASRFFKSIIYTAKASKSERNKGCEELEEKSKVFNGQSNKPSKDMKDVEKRFTTLPKANNHPTVKPITLMEYLIKMVTKEGGTVLDPFTGSGTTLVAAKRNLYNYIGFELSKEYCDIIEARLKPVQVGLF